MVLKEVELKILEVNRSVVELCLTTLGAEKQFEQDFFAIIFDTPGGDLLAAGKLLRLRKEGLQNTLTFKSPLSQGKSKVMEETETEVEEFKTMRKILKNMGYDEVLSTRKIRIQYKLPQGKVVFDKYKDQLELIPEFMELETQSEEAMARLLLRLNLDIKDCKAWNTRDLMHHYGIK